MTNLRVVKDQRRTQADFDQSTAPDARTPKPTDDELGDQLIADWKGNYAFMYGAWHFYASGLWRADRRVEFQFWNILIRNKARGIKPNAGKASSVEKYCQLRLLVDEEALTLNTPYINLRNGLFNLDANELEYHRPDLYLTSQLDFEFDPSATCPTWEHFLQSVLVQEDGSTDWQLIQLVREAFFYSLTSDTSYRVSFWLVGASGTGKSTLVNTLIMLAGDSHTSIDLDSLRENPYQLAEIAGKRVVTFSEPDSRQPLADGLYKKIVSKDPITARSPYGKPFSFVPLCKVWGSMNDTPRVSDRSDAVFGRVIIIPMNRVIPESEKDYQLEDKLRAEIAGIFNWALQGRETLHKFGFTHARQSEDARQQYKLENDIERAFVSERCVFKTGEKLSNDELYLAYRSWCSESGYLAKGKIAVGKEWKRLGLVQVKSGDGKSRLWKGITFQRGS